MIEPPGPKKTITRKCLLGPGWPGKTRDRSLARAKKIRLGQDSILSHPTRFLRSSASFVGTHGLSEFLRPCWHNGCTDTNEHDDAPDWSYSDDPLNGLSAQSPLLELVGSQLRQAWMHANRSGN
jgi:hypothetical protein